MNYYELFGLSPKDDLSTLKKRYKELAKQHHPDKGGDPAMMTFINEGYEYLLEIFEKKEKEKEKAKEPHKSDNSDRPFVDYYQLLGLTSKATSEEIQGSYRILKKDYSEDKSPTGRIRLQHLEDAIDILSFSESRLKYDLDYEKNVNKSREADKPKHKDYSKFRQKNLDNWRDIFAGHINPGKLLEDVISRLVLLPDAEVQVPVLAAYLAIPTCLTSTIPILFCQGVSGSGKTQILELAKITWNLSLILTANTTGVALRNDIKELKYWDPENSAHEKLIHGIVFDDLSAGQFILNPYLYSLLKAGYKRGADTIKIADKDGKNFTFRVFGGRAFSSITPFDSLPEYSELHRRLLTIKTALDKRAIVLNPEWIDWRGFHQNLFDFWDDESNTELFCETYISIEKLIAKGKLPLHSHHASISGAILAAGIVSGVWASQEDAIEGMKSYWSLISEKRTYMQSSTLREIKEYVDNQKDKAMLNGRKLLFTGKALNDHLERLRKEGHLDTIISVPQLAEIMRGMGFRLIQGIWEKAE